MIPRLGGRALQFTTGTGDAVISGPIRVLATSIVSHTTDADLGINDALTTAGGGTTMWMHAVANQSTMKYFGPNGVRFGTGLSAILTGTAAVGEIYYVED